MTSYSDESLIQEFVTESREHLSTIEPDLLVLEKLGKDTDAEVINRIFRAIHSIKGASGFFGFEALKKLSHVMENLLMMVRDKTMEPSPTVVQPLLLGVDKLNAMMEDVHNCDQVNCSDEIEKLEALLQPDAAKKSETVSASDLPSDIPAPEKIPHTEELPVNFVPAFQVDEDVVKACKSNGQNIFTLLVSLNNDLHHKGRSLQQLLEQIEAVGTMLDVVWDTSRITETVSYPEEDIFIYILYASVLEFDLATMAVDLPGGQVRAFDLDAPAPATEPATSQVQALNKILSTPDSSVEQTKKEASVETDTPAERIKKPSMGSSESSETIRVKVDLLNKLMDLAGEMVLSRNQLMRKINQEQHSNDGLDTIAQSVSLITTQLQEHIMQTRMQPIGSVFNKFPRIVRDMARQLDKEIDIVLQGEDVELDKSIIESLSDPLTHLIRNACDHAIELPAERESKGKKPKGIIQLSAYHSEGQIHIAIQDDGRGIDAEKIGKKALDKELVTKSELDKMSPSEVVQMIFLPGFSMAEKISEISGRGVGMDVVKTNITKLGGQIKIETIPNKGTTILLQLPLTLAIIPSLIVEVSNHRFAMPQISVVELVRVRAADAPKMIKQVGANSVLRLREKLLPLLYLADILGLKRTYVDPKTKTQREDRRSQIAVSDFNDDNENAVIDNQRQSVFSDYNILILKVGAHQFGLIVDEMKDTEEIVVKPMSRYLKECKCFSGSTIMGDGRVAMILDPAGILGHTKLSFEKREAEKTRVEQERAAELEQAKNRRTLLLFNNAEDDVFAVPLSEVLRLEKIQMNQIERMGRTEVIQYEGRVLSIIRLDQFLTVSPFPSQLDSGYLIIPKASNGHHGGQVGILVSNIIDTIETTISPDDAFSREPGLIGSAIVQGQLTLFVDCGLLIKRSGILVGVA
ncbi:MAG: chemotaxis protein CheA [Cyanobacteria bacterium]|nr:chemotaxis protein CheA [Cyanobacteriota bacterium]